MTRNGYDNRDEDVDLHMNRNEKATTKQTAWGMKILKAWLIEKNEDTNFEFPPPDEIAAILRRLYAEARSRDGERYSKSSLSRMRAAINRCLNSPPYHRNINIIQDTEFKAANNIFTALIKQFKADGLDKTCHKTPIITFNLRKLTSSTSGVMSTSDPLSLLRKI
ncbi:uncharacterized protein LOC144344213 [Saccoglossus kowalevskii]